MAAPKKTKARFEDLAGQADPQAALDPSLLLRTAQPVLKALAEDLLARAKASPALTAALSARHAAEQAHERTADPYDVWLRFFAKQVAAAWFLSCVFVRVLEDRGLVDQHRIAGPGALDSQQLFFELAPSLSERDYLLTVFRELSALPAAAELFDARHNPVWLLAPSADGAKQLLQLFRTPTAGEPALRFGQADTRFLGDLYQDLDEDVRERFALLQTPHFVESFILDRTLERAIARFGLDDSTLIDPTCGSGHFLLGAFERLFEHRLRSEPGLELRQAAHKALAAIYGADINPYAVAIARFRLTLAFLDKAGYKKLADAPKLPLHLAVADSLLHNPQKKLAYLASDADAAQLSFGEKEGQSAEVWEGGLYALEDEAATRDVLYRRHAAVVGNPPYITVKDKALRERYRQMYASAGGKYSLGAPFTERFFQLARERGAVGMITANSFMKREFGKALIEKCLPTVNLDLVANTSGAYIPGHGTPTVLLFGTAEAPHDAEVLTVLAKRGEPSTPDDAQKGAVWSSIAEHWSEVGFENDYISVARTSRSTLAKHPWSLGGGGAAELKELLEERAEKRLKDVVDDIGFASFTGLDDAFILPAHVPVTHQLEQSVVRYMVLGEDVRDWTSAPPYVSLTPYSKETQQAIALDVGSRWGRFLWPYRTTAKNVASFGGKTREDEGQNWWEWYRWQPERYRSPFRITFAFVATHNHFVLDRGGKVFNRSAPIIKLPESATEDDHLALLAYLNSSTACFYFRQVLHSKGAQGVNEGHKAEEWEQFLEFSGTQVGTIPLPPNWRSLLPYGARLAELATQRSALDPLDEESPERDRSLLHEMVGLQEALDYEVYNLFSLVDSVPRPEPMVPGSRPFELELARASTATAWFTRHSYERPDATTGPVQIPAAVTLLEQPLYKRRWLLRDWSQRRIAAEQEAALTRAERTFAGATLARSVRELAGIVPEADKQAIAREQLAQHAIPFLAAHRYTDSGLDKRAAWERTWELQRREDAGEKVGDIPVPPKYDNKDFRDPNYFRLRGKLDVPKERFISYPGCESDEDGEPVYGWAGWNHLQQAQALAALYQARKSEAWKPERLTSMLAGLLELLPWLKQWHNEPSSDFDGLRLGDYFESFLEGECATQGVTRDQLRAWRPEKKGRSASSAKTKAKRSPKAEPAEEGGTEQ